MWGKNVKIRNTIKNGARLYLGKIKSLGNFTFSKSYVM